MKEIDLPQNCRYLTTGAQAPTLPCQVVYNDTLWKYVPKVVETMYFWLIVRFYSVFVHIMEHTLQQIWQNFVIFAVSTIKPTHINWTV